MSRKSRYCSLGLCGATHGAKIAEIKRIAGGVSVLYTNGRLVEHLGAMVVEYAKPEPEE